MNKKTMWLLIGALAIFIVGVMVGQGCNKRPGQSAATIAKIKDTPPEHKKDAGGTDHAEKQVAEGSTDQMRAFFLHQIDSLTALIDANTSNVTSYVGIGTESSGEMSNGTAADYTDTPVICPGSLSWSDQWSKIQATNDSGSWKVKYSFRDSLNLITYWKKKGLKKNLYVNAFSYNPHTTIVGLNEMQLPAAKPKKFGIGLNASWSFYNGKFRPSAGVGIQYNLIRF